MPSEEESLEVAAIDRFISDATLVKTERGSVTSLKDLYAAKIESSIDRKARLKRMLLWFRENFPYYYSGCQYSNLDCDNNDKNGAEFLGCVYQA